MKIYITKTSDWDYKKFMECDNLEDCIDTLLTFDQKELVISKVPDYYSEEAKQCDYKIEIYDTWRE